MTTFKNTVNAFGNSAGDSLSTNVTTWHSEGASFPKGKLKRYPGKGVDPSVGNRRLAKAQHGTGGGSGTTFRKGVNAFSRGGKGR